MSKDLIDHLGIYKARTLPRQAYHYCVSTRAAQELERWPTVDVIDGARAGGTPGLQSPSAAEIAPQLTYGLNPGLTKS